MLRVIISHVEREVYEFRFPLELDWHLDKTDANRSLDGVAVLRRA